VLNINAATCSNKNYSVLAKGTSAEVQISIRAASISGPSSSPRPIPLEPFSSNKDMGRILIRRGGETIGAGELLNTMHSISQTDELLGIVLKLVI
jgi:elongation factor 1 alpha-like protein